MSYLADKIIECNWQLCDMNGTCFEMAAMSIFVEECFV